MILVKPVEYLFHEAVGLGAAQIASMAAGVVVILLLRFVEDEVVHVVVPDVRVLAVFRRKALGIIHMAEAGVVGGQHKLHPLRAVGHLV